MTVVRLEALEPGRYQVQGDLTFDTAAEAYALSAKLFESDGDVLVDIGQVKRVDSAGLACLLEWMREGKSRGSDVLFENPQAQLSSLIRLSGLDKLIKLAA